MTAKAIVTEVKNKVSKLKSQNGKYTVTLASPVPASVQSEVKSVLNKDYKNVEIVNYAGSAIVNLQV